MKKSFMTRALATGLSLAMAFSLTAATNVTTAAAASAPAMKSKTMTVKVDQSKNYAATAATQKAYKITKIKMSADGKTKAKVTINSSKKSIKVTGLKATKGKNVVITFKNNKTGKKTTVTTKVVVKAVDTATKIASVKQNTFTEFTVTMSKALETVAASDFSMVRDNDNQVITVKSATLDTTDKTKVKLVVYTSLTDAKTYTVTYTANDEAKTQSTAKVTVTDGTVADVAITPVEITANKATLIEYQTLDANGVIISQKAVKNAETKVVVDWDSALGTMNDDSNYILYNVGDTAKFTVTYHTYKYDTTTGAELDVITKDFTVTAVKDATVVSQYTYTAAIDEPYDWSKVTPKTTIALDDTGAAQRKAWFLIKDSKGDDVTARCGYTVESSDNSIVVADGNVTGTDLMPVAKGSAYLMIKDTDGKVVQTLPITVGDKRTLATFKLSASTVNIVSSASTSAPATCGYTDVIAKDQYGEDITVGLTVDDEKSTSKVSEIDTNFTVKGSIRVTGENDGASADKGTDRYIIKATDGLNKTMITSLTVNSVAVTDANPTYSVVFLDDTNANKVITSVDTTVSEKKADLSSKTIHAAIVAKKNGVVVSTASGIAVTSLTVKKNGGTTVAQVVSKDGIAEAVSGKAIDATAIKKVTTGALNADAALPTTVRAGEGNGATAEKHLGVGTYQYYYELVIDGTKKDKAVATLTVTDKQTAVTAKVKSTSFGNAGAGEIKTKLKDEDYIEFYYGSKKIAMNACEIKAAKTYTSDGTKNIFVTDVTVEVPVANSGNKMLVVVPINKTFTASTGTWVNS